MFDQLGPQLRWWAWNTGNPLNHPMLASVPMTSVFIFATLGPIVVTVLVLLLVRGRPDRRDSLGGLRLTWRTVAAGALVPLGVAILSIPSSLFGGDNPNTTAQAVIFCVELGAVALVAVPVLVQQWLRKQRDGTPMTPNAFVRIFGPVYLLVLAGLWASAFSNYFDAANGVTADSTPTGNLLYATASFVVAALAVYSVSTATRIRAADAMNEHAVR